MFNPDNQTSPADNDQFSAISQAIPGLMWFCDPEGVCNYASPQCRDYTGTDFVAARGMGGFAFTHPEDGEGIATSWAEALKRGNAHDCQLRLRRHDGVYRWHRFHGVPEFNEKKTIKRWVVVCIDIDEAKKTQQESAAMRQTLLRAKEELERTVSDRTKQLQQVVEQLESFAYSIAHDMRAPLRSMHQYAMMVSQDFPGEIPAGAQLYLQKITSAAEKLDILIREVLVYTRVSQGEMDLKTTDLDRVLSEVLIVLPQLNSPRIDLQIRRPLHTVTGNETALIQVFSNLLANAVKFMPPDRNPKIEIWTEADGDNVRIYFQDNGIGVPSQDREKIFQMFERLQPAVKYEGSGIGLSIVRRAIERMSGKIGVEASDKVGTTFWIELKKGQDS